MLSLKTINMLPVCTSLKLIDEKRLSYNIIGLRFKIYGIKAIAYLFK
jgi:hypothetical protein